MSGASITPLFAEVEPVTGADLETVAVLRDLLDRAESGSIVGLAWAASNRNGDVSHGWEGASATRGYLAMGILALHYRYGAAMCGADE